MSAAVISAQLFGIVSWDPVLTGYLAVIISMAVLCGSVYLLLATNLGVRLGFLVAWTGLWGWMLLMSIVWWIFGIGWIGAQPGWNVLQVATNPAVVPIPEVQQLPASAAVPLPADWTEVDEADARSAADSHVACSDADPRRLLAVNSCLFTAASDYFTHRVAITGGERYRPLGVPDNAITQYFFPSRGRPNYAVVQIQGYAPGADIDPNVVDDEGAPIVEKPRVDPGAPVYSVVMVRDHGSVRLRPALLTIFSALLFGLGCYHLHRRDQAIWAVREAAGQ
ncbi:hypothetical protein [Candidatus Poriferisodalis sp.]|uniref:hypothetical protein n=1 Tax=Candidatus Poriferisodalis sp. TaxID=3101277 RepID=UPI003B0127F9